MCGTTREQVSIEERLSQNERRILTEAQKQFDVELAELRERIDAVQKVRSGCKFILPNLRQRRTRFVTFFGEDL